jgi:hypothetical protein
MTAAEFAKLKVGDVIFGRNSGKQQIASIASFEAVVTSFNLVGGGNASTPEFWHKTPAPRRAKAKRKHAK